MTGMKMPQTLRLPAMLLAAFQAAPALADDKPAEANSDITVYGSRPAINPYGDDSAPYKVDRLAGEKFVVPLLDLPRTVTVIPREVIEDQGALSFRDLVRTQPGITLGTGEGGNAYGDRTFIRGFDARNDVYIDGFRDPGVTQREVFAIQQIEVIKGPSATYGGRGTTGGSVNFVTKKPQNTSFVAANATLGTDATRRITADANYRVSDALQFRVNGLYSQSDAAGRNQVWNDRWGVFAAALWTPASNIEVGADYYHLDWRALPDWGMPFDARTQQPFTVVDRRNWYGVLSRDFLTTKVDTGTVKLAWDIADKIRLSSISRYGWNLNSYIASAPEAPNITDPNPANWTVRANPKSRNARSTFYGNQTQVRFDFDTGILKHKLVVGGELSRERVTNQPFAFAQSETVGSPVVPTIVVTLNLFNPDPNYPWSLFRTLSGAKNVATIDSKAVFALDTIDITPKLQISGGLRWDDFKLKLYSIAAPTTAIPTPQALNLKRHDSFLNWNAGIVYKPVPSVSLYASATTSSNPSGEQTDGAAAAYGGLTVQTVNLEPEKNRAYEIGAKWEAGGHLLLTAAVFRTTKLNARVSPPPGSTTTELQLIGKQRSQGVELGASGNITPAWSVYGGFVYLDAKVLKGNTAAIAGLPFPNVPKYSGSLLTSYAIDKHVTVGGQASYYSLRHGGNNLANAAGASSIPAYWRYDANVRFKANDAIEFQINGLNLTDKPYFEALYQSATPFSYQAPGRTVLFTFRVVQ